MTPLLLLLAAVSSAQLDEVMQDAEDVAGEAVEAVEEAAHADDEDDDSPAAGEGEPGQYSDNGSGLRVYTELPGQTGRAARVLYHRGKKCLRTKFKDGKPTHVVVHNGGSARKNRDSWRCGQGAHYTVNRDGKVFQHYGEEWVTAHANLSNRYALGVELETVSVKIGKRRYRCNKINDAGLKNPKHLPLVRQACAPTDAQYASLKALLEDISARKGIPIDEKSIIGHCEAKGQVNGDPRAFDWDRVGIDKAKKNALFKKSARMRANCKWYEPAP